ncbi:MAG: cytidine deaminase, partial [Pseudomonadota bacterium]
HMVMNGEHDIAEVCVFATRADKATPCGGCRQRLMEFGKASTSVYLCDANGIVETVTLGDLLPFAFNIED